MTAHFNIGSIDDDSIYKKAMTMRQRANQRYIDHLLEQERLVAEEAARMELIADANIQASEAIEKPKRTPKVKATS